MPHVLIVHYSRTGHTARLAEVLAAEIRLRRCDVDTDVIRVECMAVSSNYHPYFSVGGMERLFRFVSRMAFKRPLIDFTLDGEIGKIEVQRFCDVVCPK